MKKIFKFELRPTEIQGLSLLAEAQILCVKVQRETIILYALVEPQGLHVDRTFAVYGTGHDVPEIPGASREYIGTVLLKGGGLVFHVFEIIYDKK